jgi:hypothetical protein
MNETARRYDDLWFRRVMQGIGTGLIILIIAAATAWALS